MLHYTKNIYYFIIILGEKMNQDKLNDIIGKNIKKYRLEYKDEKITQEKLAELSKLSPRYITDVERGLHCPTIPKIESIANSLNIEPYKLFVNIDRDINIVNKMKNVRQYNQK